MHKIHVFFLDPVSVGYHGFGAHVLSVAGEIDDDEVTRLRDYLNTLDLED